ncbi:MAG TPA: GNAT family N-acetyltransferase [Homoserinimonas sp.]|nr:GNAT family N-acetyltransferase [Homoserinimonas sp.]
MSEPAIEHVPAIHHYELRSDGDLIGHVNYRDDGDRRVFLHTQVDEAFTGQGLASRLVRFVLEDVRASGMRAVALCPMVSAYVIKHRDYDDIVDPPHVLDSKS